MVNHRLRRFPKRAKYTPRTTACFSSGSRNVNILNRTERNNKVKAKQSLSEVIGIRLPNITKLQRVGSRPWNSPHIKTDLSIKHAFKEGQSTRIARVITEDHFNSKYANHLKIFTDGSNSGYEVGVGVIGPNFFFCRKKSLITVQRLHVRSCRFTNCSTSCSENWNRDTVWLWKLYHCHRKRWINSPILTGVWKNIRVIFLLQFAGYQDILVFEETNKQMQRLNVVGRLGSSRLRFWRQLLDQTTTLQKFSGAMVQQHHSFPANI